MVRQNSRIMSICVTSISDTSQMCAHVMIMQYSYGEKITSDSSIPVYITIYKGCLRVYSNTPNIHIPQKLLDTPCKFEHLHIHSAIFRHPMQIRTLTYSQCNISACMRPITTKNYQIMQHSLM